MSKQAKHKTNAERRSQVEEYKKRILQIQRLMDAVCFARELVVKAAMETFHKGYITNDLCVLHKACSALEDAEKIAARDI